MSFRLIDRGKKNPIFLAPGWGFLGDIFLDMDIPYDFIIPEDPILCYTCKDLASFLDSLGVPSVFLLGWSLGAFYVLDFLKMYPDRTRSLFLVSVRSRYQGSEMDELRKRLERDKTAALTYFYRLCFWGNRKGLEYFRMRFQTAFISKWSQRLLEQGLGLLEKRELDLSVCQQIPVRIFHGEKDMIAPKEDLPRLVPGLRPEIIPGAGHLPFLSPEFKRKFDD